jgi:hypothetical protein
MATKNDIIYYLENTYDCVHISDILLKIDLMRSDGRTQWVYIGVSETEAHIYSYFANVEDYTPNQILPFASDNSQFGVNLIGDKYALVHIVGFTNLIATDLPDQFAMLAVSADSLESMLKSMDTF